EVSAAPIRQEAERPFLLGIAGSPAFIEAVVEELLGPDAAPQERALAEARLGRAPGPPTGGTVAALSRCDGGLVGEGAPGAARIRPAEVIAVADPSRAPQLLLDFRPHWRLALARHLPGLRSMVADRLIHEISKVNAQWAMVTAVPKAIPGLAFLFPSF